MRMGLSCQNTDYRRPQGLCEGLAHSLRKKMQNAVKGVDRNAKVDYTIINYEDWSFEQANSPDSGRNPDKGQEVGKRVFAT